MTGHINGTICKTKSLRSSSSLGKLIRMLMNKCVRLALPTESFLGFVLGSLSMQVYHIQRSLIHWRDSTSRCGKVPNFGQLYPMDVHSLLHCNE